MKYTVTIEQTLTYEINVLATDDEGARATAWDQFQLNPNMIPERARSEITHVGILA